MSARTPGPWLAYHDNKRTRDSKGDVLLVISGEPPHAFYIHGDYAPRLIEACNAHDAERDEAVALLRAERGNIEVRRARYRDCQAHGEAGLATVIAETAVFLDIIDRVLARVDGAK